VQEFEEGLSHGMMTIPELFHNIPDNSQLPGQKESRYDTNNNGGEQAKDTCPAQPSAKHGKNPIW
jgi:hypothetical protein